MAVRRKTTVRRFGSREGYRKWLAYGHMRSPTGKLLRRGQRRRSMMSRVPGGPRIYIRGKLHRVKHGR